MKIVVDTHTHSILSGYAYSTIQEMAREAPVNGIEMFALTDHGPSMPHGAWDYYFGNLQTIPDIIYGVRVVKGVEANIIDYNGSIDMKVEYLKKLDFVIASFHEICIEPSTIENHTNAFINVLKNPLIDVIAHPGNPVFPVDIDKVVRTAKEYNKLIEINNHSFKARAGSEANCKTFARKCIEYGVRMVCASDAHISFDIGKFEKVIKLFESVNMPEELILNTSSTKFEKYLAERKERIAKIKKS